jgi:predicted DsbA family dithiol-disulfide isomerase
LGTDPNFRTENLLRKPKAESDVMNALNIEIFSDLICPWCSIGKRRLEAALKILGANELPNIIWRPFELNPDIPKMGLNRKAYRSAKFGSWERSQAMDREK